MEGIPGEAFKYSYKTSSADAHTYTIDGTYSIDRTFEPRDISVRESNYKITESVELRIDPKQLVSSEYTVGELTYNAKPQTPDVEVYDGGNLLEEDTHYTLSVSQETNVPETGQKYHFTVTGKGNYAGAYQGD